MSLSYECRQLIDSRDVDETGFCKASALLGHMQEAATQAAEGSAFGRDALLHSRNAFWMLTRIFFRLRRPLGWEEEITLRTWHRGGRGAVLYRDFDLLAGDGPVGEVVSAWVLADVDSRRLLRLADIPELQGTEGENCKTRKLTKLRRPAELVLAERRPMHYSDTDINGHVNNTRYADFACDAVGMPRPGQFFRSCGWDTWLSAGLGRCWRFPPAERRTGPLCWGATQRGRLGLKQSLCSGHFPSIRAVFNCCLLFWNAVRPFGFTLIRHGFAVPPSPVRGKARTLALTPLHSSIGRRSDKPSPLTGEGGWPQARRMRVKG